MLQSVWNDFQKCCTEQGADCIGNQGIDALRADRSADSCRSGNAQNATSQGDGNNPGKGAQGDIKREKRRELYAGKLICQPDQAGHAPGDPIATIGKIAF